MHAMIRSSVTIVTCCILMATGFVKRADAQCLPCDDVLDVVLDQLCIDIQSGGQFSGGAEDMCQLICLAQLTTETLLGGQTVCDGQTPGGGSAANCINFIVETVDGLAQAAGLTIDCNTVPTTCNPVNLQIDSDNNNGFSLPAGSAFEEQIEDISGDPNSPGKIMTTNTGNVDMDGIQDSADGYNADGVTGTEDDQTPGVSFIPLSLTLAPPLDLDVAQVRISYADSPPPATGGQSGTPFLEANGAQTADHLRLWAESGGTARRGGTLLSVGDYIAAGVYPASAFGFANSRRTITVFLEGIKPSLAIADQRIRVDVDPDGGGPDIFRFSDATRVTLIRVDLDIAGVAEADEETVGAFICVNNDDDNGNGTADRNDTGPIDNEDDLVPLMIELVPLQLTGTLTLSAGTGNINAVSENSRGNIRVWGDPHVDKGSRIILPKTWTLGVDSVPTIVYVEGVSTETDGGKFELRLIFQNIDFGSLLHEFSDVVRGRVGDRDPDTGACLPPGDCRTNRDCPPNFYCAKQPGDCDGAGRCRPRPDACLDVYDPVCGCDGTTYGNACEAAAAGANIEHQGPCRLIGDCRDNSDCSDGSYCAKEASDCDGRGVCTPQPQICPLILDLVCGCDGETYSNACFAAAAGVNVAHRGPCVPTGECRDNRDCLRGFYCAKKEGDCDRRGVCKERPNACPDIWDPVCGCDGNTYGNACEAAAAGVNVDHGGPCVVVEECRTNDDCPDGAYCAKAHGDCGGKGVCRRIPDACPKILDPVCGCDGETYDNACFAAAKGVNVKHRGRCKENGCLTNDDCPDGSYCAKKAGGCDKRGICKEKPTACPDIWDPVCGCDGHTYSNACDAAAAGVNVARRGICVPETCTSNDECLSGFYCAKRAGDCDGIGKCSSKPEICTEQYDPVCGCDGNTYSNACHVAAAGVNVAHRGPCQHVRCNDNSNCPTGHYCAKRDGDCDGGGICRQRPTACPDIWAPVCGCDGLAYSNACDAAAAGVNVDYRGPCVVVEECLTNADCPEDSYCAKKAGDCDGPGGCRVRPVACSDIFDPVCGCDGQTYSNACFAARTGVNVTYEGQCVEICTSNADCPPDQYCAKAAADCDGRGECRPRPEVCPLIFDPVCGCDGQTYSNACIAAQTGVNIDHGGPCDPSGCTTNEDCAEDEYCVKVHGDCDGNGESKPRPQGCPLIFAPVCGCDGETYSNACFAARVGVNVDYLGLCIEPPCTSNADCDHDQYCAKAEGDCDGEGECTPRPETCILIFDPVCGCDGQTYSNACVAAQNGVSIEYRGACVPIGDCRDNPGCPAGSYCAKAEGDCAGRGVCRPRPDICLEIFAPVCGCDGTTYANACEAALYGVNVAHSGMCEPSGCRDNSDCGRDEYCAKAAGDCDGEGECTPRPRICPLIFAPVCGCDSETYSNFCEAAQHGVNVVHEGPCVPSGDCRDNRDCAANEYCAKELGNCDGRGTCTPRPDICIAIFAPVCGCDGNTYSNVCDAATHGVNVRHNDPCETGDCTENSDCPDGFYCAKAAGDCDGQGECEPRPQGCGGNFDPVCGCDGNTYGNACFASQHGVNVVHTGVCN